jgi:hypothetical protein
MLPEETEEVLYIAGTTVRIYRIFSPNELLANVQAELTSKKSNTDANIARTASRTRTRWSGTRTRFIYANIRGHVRHSQTGNTHSTLQLSIHQPGTYAATAAGNSPTLLITRPEMTILPMPTSLANATSKRGSFAPTISASI